MRKATQIFGRRKAIHFYAVRDLVEGDELTWDYGNAYWDALGVTPIET